MSSHGPQASRLPPELVGALPTGLAVVDSEGALFDADHRWERFVDEHGLPPTPSPGEAYLGSLQDADDASVRALGDRLAELLAAPAVETVEIASPPLRLVRFDHDGASFVALLCSEPGEASMQAELRLKERAMDEAPVGITISDPHLPDNPVIYANEAFERITGYPTKEVVGRNCRFLQGEDTDEETVRQMREAIDAEEPITVDVLNYRRNGEKFWNEITIAPLWEDGEVAHYVGFQKDATDRKRAEQELATERDRLAVLNQIVRHDIRNDMAVAIGWGEQLREHVDPEGKTALERVLNAATHTKELTASVRDLAQLIGAEDPSLTTVPVRETLTEEVQRVRSNFDYRSESLTVELGEVPSDLEVEANSLLSSVFGNLLDNAVFHNDKEEIRIEVSVEEREDTAVVRIADNGPGIPDERKREVFGRGEKGLESPGSGLGLYLVDYLVETFGGSAWIEDNEPEGTVFCVELQKAGDAE